MDSTYSPPFEFLVDGLLAKGNLAMLAGPHNSGKSLLALQMLRAIDEGKRFLGRKTQQARVLYLSLEDSEAQVRQRVKNLQWRPSSRARMGFFLPELDGQGLGRIATLAPFYDLIVIDPLFAAVSSNVDGNSNAQMTPIMRQLRTIASDTPTAIVLVHHTRSRRNHEDIFRNIWGAEALRRECDVVILLEKGGGEKSAVLHMEINAPTLRKIGIRQADDGAFVPSAIGGGAGRRVVEALRSEGDGATSQQLADSISITVSSARLQLKNAERDGLVRRETSKAGSKFRPLDVWFVI